jgi:hypothetical protein
MRKKKIPLRKCIGCGEMKPKQELVRVVRAPSVTDEEGVVLQKGEISLDSTGKQSGRGAYVCPNPECLQAARKARRLERSFSCKIPDDLYDQLEEEMTHLAK